jgi:amino acid permease
MLTVMIMLVIFWNLPRRSQKNIYQLIKLIVGMPFRVIGLIAAHYVKKMKAQEKLNKAEVARVAKEEKARKKLEEQIAAIQAKRPATTTQQQ